MDEQSLPVGNETVKTDKLSQKEAVYQYTVEVLSGMNLSLDERLKRILKSNKKDLPDDEKRLASEVKKSVRAKLLEGFSSQKISLSAEKSSNALTKYCSGLVSHWIKKDQRFQ